MTAELERLRLKDPGGLYSFIPADASTGASWAAVVAVRNVMFPLTSVYMSLNFYSEVVVALFF